MLKIKKNKLVIILCTITSFFLLTGCNLNKKKVLNIYDDRTYNKEFGSYEVLSGWIESKKHSTNDKFFYVLNGTENEKTPNNISVNVGSNKYSADEHENFRSAIVSQLLRQIGGKDGVELNANGSYTKKHYRLYTFIIKHENITTTLCYIVGDYKHVLIQETNFDGSDEVDEVTKNIVNTFEWNE